MSNEFFYLDANGRKSDAALHEDILDNPEADLACRIETARGMIADGHDEQNVRMMYDIPADVSLLRAKSLKA
jgi:hypothetical protein